MPNHLDASAVVLGDMLARERHLVIPNFQRPYAWTEHEAVALFSDIRAAQTEATENGDDAPPYFLGTIVLARTVGSDLMLIVDGQQRLTTLTIMIAILRDLDADGEERFGEFVLRPGHEMKPRLSPRPLDTTFFRDRIQRFGATLQLSEDTPVDNDAQGNILTVALKLRSEIDRIGERSRVWFGEYLLRQCALVEVSAPAEDQAYRIFKVMNARGRNLSDNDLLKSELLGHVPPQRQNAFTALWEKLEADLGSKNFTTLFGHLRMIHRPGRPRMTVVQELREILDPASDPEKFLREELEPKGKVYLELLNGTLNFGARSAEISLLLRSLSRIPNSDWAPPAIAYLSERKPSGSEAAAFLAALERLSYGLFIQAGDENVRNSRYRIVLREIAAKAPIETLIKCMDLTAHDRKIARTVLDGAIYQKERIRLPVLLRLDERLADSVARYDHGQVSVEHVLPRNPPPGSPWLLAFPDEKDRRYWTDRLGNLALLSRRKNNEAANLPFEEKKQTYFTRGGVTPFALTTQVYGCKEWTPAVVRERHKKLFDLAVEIWNL